MPAPLFRQQPPAGRGSRPRRLSGRRRAQPWRALKRRWVLLITYTRPLRRTTRQSRWRAFRERSELRTFTASLLVQRRADVPAPQVAMRPLRGPVRLPLAGKMVGVTGIEPVTPSMSTKCSPAELYAREAGGSTRHAVRSICQARVGLQALLPPSRGALYCRSRMSRGEG